ncbi:MAG: glycosyltransferase [Calditrichaeota bacterium]|nr:glycosyltransferase [Calditrichota bacterium]
MTSQSQFPEIGIICFVPDNWSSTWTTRHHIITRLGRYFKVFWVNPTPYWREIFNLKNFLKNSKKTDYKNDLGIYIHTPFMMFPKFYSPKILASFSEYLRLYYLQKFVTSIGIKKILLYIWRPDFCEMLFKIKHDWSCYHIDDEYSFSEKEQPLGTNEKVLLSSTDQVIIHSPALMEKKGKFNKNTLYVTNGVDYKSYILPHKEPKDLINIPHPRIVYVGMIKKQLNLQLLLDLSKRHSMWNFIFIGPKNATVNDTLYNRLYEQKNVYFLGKKSVEDLPKYIQHMNVGLLPYLLNDYTKYIYPLKLHEYLASGLPAVGSSIRSLKDFSHVIYLANSIDEWSESIEKALKPEEMSKEKVSIRQSVAKEYDWDHLVFKIAKSFCGLLGNDYVEQLDTFIQNQKV